ncbi:hypothetical protein [Sporosarcina sp. G11-34]|uniref:hypothetical protein n=1 Tax=Sporosarcina sp. G11-34 TaxID=2849605 RepID=UPI0022A8D50D|nr:hypothetical protein [Sporosarcina sp. G11-34]MCZ2260925.1 hypothetical protein [Sporosarcina sp. G11-34]
MLHSLMQESGFLYYETWFIWPFVFVISLVLAISSLVKDDKISIKHTIIASISLLIILSGVNAPIYV